MKDLKKGFKEFAEILRKAKENGELKGYALIGGFAVSARARPRATKDIDFLIDARESFFDDWLSKIISSKGYTAKIFKGDITDPVKGVIRIYDEDGSEFVDLIPIFWKWHAEIIQMAEEIELFGKVTVPVARIEDLIVLKLKAGGTIDMFDVDELLKATKFGAKIDMIRLKELAKRAGVDKKLHKILGKIY